MGRDEEFAPLVHCPNPEHDNYRSPAFQVNLRYPLVHCFSDCGISGTYEHAICTIEGLYEKFQVKNATNYQETARRKNRARREAKKIILRGATGFSRHERIAPAVKKNKPVSLDYDPYLRPVAQDYLALRGINEQSISFWGFGWDPDEKRLVIPAHDENGKLKFLIKRAVLPTQNPKYLYSEGAMKSDVLFGADKIRQKGQHIVIAEGSIDVIKLHQHGMLAVGLLGTGISDEQMRILAGLL